MLFYCHALESGIEAKDRQMFFRIVQCVNDYTPFYFVGVPKTSLRSFSGSHFNEAEAEMCRQIVPTMLTKDVAPTSIAIIAFYKEQFRLFQGFAKSLCVDIHTVDSVQGREKDMVILLTTRTDFDASRADFLEDSKRLNVAISRYRHGQFVLGHQRSLAKLPNWHRLLEWAHHRHCFTTASALSDFE